MTMFLLLSFVCFVLAIHPFIIYPLTLRLFKRKPVQPPTPDYVQPSFAICVCAYNEAAVIVRKAENLLALKRSVPGVQVYIYVDAASDNTAQLLEPYMEHFNIHVSPERHGKSHGMNLLVRQARADVVVFSDANVMLAPDALIRLAPYFADPAVGCVCGQLIYVNEDAGTTAANGSLYWRLEENIKRLESATGSLMGADGSIFAIRRTLHRPPPDDIIDDMYVSFSILSEGSRIISAPDVLAYEESVSVAHEEFRRKIRITCQAFNVHRLLWPQLRRLPLLDLYKYVSHKLIRWFVIYWLALAVLFFALALFTAGLDWLVMLLAIAGFGALAIGAKTQIKPFHQLYDIFYTFVAVGWGIWLSFRGERFKIWAPAQSIRRQS